MSLYEKKPLNVMLVFTYRFTAFSNIYTGRIYPVYMRNIFNLL